MLKLISSIYKKLYGIFEDVLGPFLVTIFVIIIATILRGTQFLQLQNIINILRNNSIVGIIAMGMTLVIISGGIDLSVGSVLVIVGAVIITVANFTGNIVLAIILGLLIGLGIGTLNAIVITKG